MSSSGSKITCEAKRTRGQYDVHILTIKMREAIVSSRTLPEILWTSRIQTLSRARSTC